MNPKVVVIYIYRLPINTQYFRSRAVRHVFSFFANKANIDKIVKQVICLKNMGAATYLYK